MATGVLQLVRNIPISCKQSVESDQLEYFNEPDKDALSKVLLQIK